ncbi:hypothetical protein [Cupriavidus sp. SK-4]|nr:hypothetical protein [Cupriavidus sp. SK-4]
MKLESLKESSGIRPFEQRGANSISGKISKPASSISRDEILRAIGAAGER